MMDDGLFDKYLRRGLCHAQQRGTQRPMVLREGAAMASSDYASVT
jgi:hypothetical protein